MIQLLKRLFSRSAYISELETTVSYLREQCAAETNLRHAAWLERQNLAKQREALWALLDNIDTLDDSCRSDDGAFRDRARREQKKRFKIYDPPNVVREGES